MFRASGFRFRGSDAEAQRWTGSVPQKHTTQPSRTSAVGVNPEALFDAAVAEEERDGAARVQEDPVVVRRRPQCTLRSTNFVRRRMAWAACIEEEPVWWWCDDAPSAPCEPPPFMLTPN